MIKKLSIAGGVAAASVASAVTLAPTGTNLQKETKQKTEEEIKAEQARIEREAFISQVNNKADELEAFIKQTNVNDSGNDDYKIFFLRDSDEEDKWKLMWIWDVLAHYLEILGKKEKNYNKSFVFSKEEMNQHQRSFWEEIIMKQQEERWKGEEKKERIDQVNEKSTEYWGKFKELCLVFLKDNLIDKNKNTNPSNPWDFLCVWSNQYLKKPWEEYQGLTGSKPEIMEYFWTVYIQRERSKNTPSR